MRPTSTHLVISVRTLVRIVRFLGLVGISLGVIGLRAAYDTVGFHSNAGHIISIAIVVAAVLATATIIVGHNLTKRREKA